jgi:predicted tellurium resistance membrane protein TerC
MIHYKIPGGVTQKTTIEKGNVMDKVGAIFGIAVLGILAIVIIGLIMSLPVMWLWNICLVAAIPGIKEIGWLQAWGLLILFGILFKSSNTQNS